MYSVKALNPMLETVSSVLKAISFTFLQKSGESFNVNRCFGSRPLIKAWPC
ncbi:hypothetical protein Wcon_00264 [Wolbachia endosymbiont of Cylisticus convexus]|nr:hypothetical protein Wcon_00264 [Wolbachia endosymbiont of Cylisticus convexus]